MSADQQFALLVRLVKSAQSPSDAASAYARANAMRPRSVALHEAYLKRMLKFGLPQVAIYPARALLSMDPEHGLASAVVGYLHGTKGELAASFEAHVVALRKLPDNPSVLNNTGQLAAWYEHTPDPPPVAAATRRWLEAILPALAEQPAYVRAYDRVVAAFKRQAEARAQYAEQLPPAEEAVRQIREKLAALETQYRMILEDIDSRRRLIDSLEYELYYYYWYDPTHGTYPQDYRRLRRAELRDRIRAEERAVDQLRQQSYAVRKQGELVAGELAKEEKALQALQAERDQAVSRIEQAFRWDPPAVDGTVTPVVEYVPVRPDRAGPPDPEVVAAQRLKVAQLYLRHGMPDKASEILREIVEQHAATQAAAPAKALLAGIKGGS